VIVGYGNMMAQPPPPFGYWGRAYTPIAAAWVDLFGEYLADVLVTVTDDIDQQSMAYSVDFAEGAELNEPGGVNNAVWPITFTAAKPGWMATPAMIEHTEEETGYVTFTMTPGGVPPTGQTTSHETGDDGDLEFGVGGFVPVTGQTTSEETGDDGDLEYGMKGAA